MTTRGVILQHRPRLARLRGASAANHEPDCSDCRCRQHHHEPSGKRALSGLVLGDGSAHRSERIADTFAEDERDDSERAPSQLMHPGNLPRHFGEGLLAYPVPVQLALADGHDAPGRRHLPDAGDLLVRVKALDVEVESAGSRSHTALVG